jgi:hypothetical protein
VSRYEALKGCRAVIQLAQLPDTATKHCSGQVLLVYTTATTCHNTQSHSDKCVTCEA